MSGGSTPGRTEPKETLPGGASHALHRVCRWLSRYVVRLPYRVRVHHGSRVPQTGPVVLVANHSAMIDGPLLIGMLPRSSVFLIKHEMFHGFAGWFLRRIGQLPVRRGEPDRTPLLAAVRLLRAGGLVGVFPEGTRGTGDVMNAQHGAAWLARSSGAVVLPVAIRGTRGARRSSKRGRRLFPRVDVLFGEPVTLPTEKGRAGLAAATERIRTELVELIAELDRLIAGRPDHAARPGQESPTDNTATKREGTERER